MIAITFALPAESSEIVRRLANKRVMKGGQISGQLADRDVHIIHTGVGEAVARRRLSDYLQDNSPLQLISSGFAGATRDDYELGDLVLASNFSDSTLLTKAENILRDQKIHTVRGWTASRVLDSPAERNAIWHQHEAVSVDMESTAIAEVCAARGLAMLSLRVLSDTPRDPLCLPGDILFNVQRQRTPMLRLLGYLARHPSSIPALIRFSRQISRIRQRLTGALVRLVESDLSA